MKSGPDTFHLGSCALWATPKNAHVDTHGPSDDWESDTMHTLGSCREFPLGPAVPLAAGIRHSVHTFPCFPLHFGLLWGISTLVPDRSSWWPGVKHHTHSPVMIWDVVLEALVYRFMDHPCRPGTFSILQTGTGLVDERRQPGRTAGSSAGHRGMDMGRGLPRLSPRLVCAPRSCS